jgi:hypothetical protein
MASPAVLAATSRRQRADILGLTYCPAGSGAGTAHGAKAQPLSTSSMEKAIGTTDASARTPAHDLLSGPYPRTRR